MELKKLLIYTKYAIQILGFTSAGDGESSHIIHATTDEYSKYKILFIRFHWLNIKLITGPDN